MEAGPGEGFGVYRSSSSRGISFELPLITKTEKTEGRTASNSEALWRLGMPFQQHPSDARLSHPKRRSKQRRRKYKTPCKSTIYVEVSVHKILSALALLIVVLASVF